MQPAYATRLRNRSGKLGDCTTFEQTLAARRQTELPASFSRAQRPAAKPFDDLDRTLHERAEALGLRFAPTVSLSSFDAVCRMVEAGLGISLVPLMPNGSVTRGTKVGVRKLPAQIMPINSGILLRRGETSPLAEALIRFLQK